MLLVVAEEFSAERQRVRRDAEKILGKKMGAECAVVKSNGIEGESPSGLAEKRQSLERKN